MRMAGFCSVSAAERLQPFHLGMNFAQLRIAHTECLEMAQRIDKVLDIGATRADAARNQLRHFLHWQTPRIAGMSGIGDEGKRAHAFSGNIDMHQAGAISTARHLTLPQIVQRFLSLLLRYLIGNAAAGAAAVKPQHQPGLFGSAAIAI